MDLNLDIGAEVRDLLLGASLDNARIAACENAIVRLAAMLERHVPDAAARAFDPHGLCEDFGDDFAREVADRLRELGSRAAIPTA